MGLKTFVNGDACLPELIAVVVPDGIDEAGLRNRLLEEYNIEIGAGLGQLAGKIWRVGLMGYTSNEKNVRLCLEALGKVLKKE